MQIDGSTKIVGVFGAPVTHTASPAMHNAAFAALGLNWVYLPFHVEPLNLRSALLGARDMGLVGVNLTVPHKVLALGVMDELTEDARRAGAVNTVAVTDGKLCGFNTDGYGFAAAIRAEFNLELKGLRVLILGAGGAARAIALHCSVDGVAEIIIANRTTTNVEPLVEELARRQTHCRSLPLQADMLAAAMPQMDLIVNATSVGLKEGESLGLPAGLFSTRHCVYDAVYRPATTDLLNTAARAGARVANGLEMLLHQGARSFEIWTKQTAPLAVMRRALRAAVYGEP
jgi:shikimate dehydrogenase